MRKILIKHFIKKIMNTKTKRIIGISAWSLLAAILVVGIIFIFSYEKPIAENVSEDGLLLNDDLIAIRENDGIHIIYNNFLTRPHIL